MQTTDQLHNEKREIKTNSRISMYVFIGDNFSSGLSLLGWGICMILCNMDLGLLKLLNVQNKQQEQHLPVQQPLLADEK